MKSIALIFVAFVVGAIVVPQLRVPAGWALAFVSLLLAGDLVLSAIGKLRRRAKQQSSRAA